MDRKTFGKGNKLPSLARSNKGVTEIGLGVILLCVLAVIAMLMLSGIFNVASKEASRAGVVADKVMTKYGSDLVTDKEATQTDKDKAAADDAAFANGIK